MKNLIIILTLGFVYWVMAFAVGDGKRPTSYSKSQTEQPPLEKGA